jgi:hypothetical protein
VSGGSGRAIDAVFVSLSAADPEEYSVDRIKAVSQRELFAAFEDLHVRCRGRRGVRGTAPSRGREVVG